MSGLELDAHLTDMILGRDIRSPLTEHAVIDMINAAHPVDGERVMANVIVLMSCAGGCR